MYLVFVLKLHWSSIPKPYECSINISFVIICKRSHNNITSLVSEFDFVKLQLLSLYNAILSYKTIKSSVGSLIV